MLRPFAILLTLAGIVTASRADAQYVVHSGPASPRTYYRPTTYSSFGSPPVASSPPLAKPRVARDDFPFYGRPYGHPYDRWTWPMMSDSYAKGMARYYAPPVK